MVHCVVVGAALSSVESLGAKCSVLRRSEAELRRRLEAAKEVSGTQPPQESVSFSDLLYVTAGCSLQGQHCGAPGGPAGWAGVQDV